MYTILRAKAGPGSRWVKGGRRQSPAIFTKRIFLLVIILLQLVSVENGARFGGEAEEFRLRRMLFTLRIKAAGSHQHFIYVPQRAYQALGNALLIHGIPQEVLFEAHVYFNLSQERRVGLKTEAKTYGEEVEGVDKCGTAKLSTTQRSVSIEEDESPRTRGCVPRIKSYRAKARIEIDESYGRDEGYELILSRS
ncbi:hypothetical protein B0H16DRAFT_1456149 [Mycena metata]|uniref:Uncharacterized protein n=1 Tax=Mycena metata TaxID=1033252 RepID=A0AAD7NII4_9AGAR|nr:hypothetical protein B0H16DRAFT_1456149 [Mycena metata]